MGRVQLIQGPGTNMKKLFFCIFLLIAAVAGQSPSPSPNSVEIGGAEFSPVGFVDFTAVYRSTNNGGIGTNFNTIPFNFAAPAGRLSEFRLSVQNSRLGFKVTAPAGSAHLTGYMEADFLGNAPGNLEVGSHSSTLRMRLYWVQASLGKWEVLAGQSWSLLTPNRKGISPMPGDIFYTQNMDTNYQAGLVWARTPGVRVVYHATSSLTLAAAAEDPEQFTGGLVTFPAGFNTSQVDDAGGNAKTPNLAPDFIAKAAYDTTVAGHALHLEAAGLYRVFRLNTAATLTNHTISAGGGSLNLNFSLTPGLNLIATSFVSDGGGRYIFGMAPDFIVRTDAAGNFRPSPLHADSGVIGLEYQLSPQTLLYGYYGGAYFGRGFQPAGSSFVGYGYPGAASGQNRAINEATAGWIQTLWKGRFGDVKLITQASYLSRNPWSTATTPAGARSAHLGMAFADLRFDLP